jgi:hypothetical protein
MRTVAKTGCVVSTHTPFKVSMSVYAGTETTAPTATAAARDPHFSTKRIKPPGVSED